MTKGAKNELVTLARYYIISVVLAVLCAEVTIFFLLINTDVGDINFAGYWRKHLDIPRWFLMSVFFIALSILRFLYVLVTSPAAAMKEKGKKAEEGSMFNQ